MAERRRSARKKQQTLDTNVSKLRSRGRKSNEAGPSRVESEVIDLLSSEENSPDNITPDDPYTFVNTQSIALDPHTPLKVAKETEKPLKDTTPLLKTPVSSSSSKRSPAMSQAARLKQKEDEDLRRAIEESKKEQMREERKRRLAERTQTARMKEQEIILSELQEEKPAMDDGVSTAEASAELGLVESATKNPPAIKMLNSTPVVSLRKIDVQSLSSNQQGESASTEREQGVVGRMARDAGRGEEQPLGSSQQVFESLTPPVHDTSQHDKSPRPKMDSLSEPTSPLAGDDTPPLSGHGPLEICASPSAPLESFEEEHAPNSPDLTRGGVARGGVAKRGDVQSPSLHSALTGRQEATKLPVPAAVVSSGPQLSRGQLSLRKSRGKARLIQYEEQADCPSPKRRKLEPPESPDVVCEMTAEASPSLSPKAAAGTGMEEQVPGSGIEAQPLGEGESLVDLQASDGTSSLTEEVTMDTEHNRTISLTAESDTEVVIMSSPEPEDKELGSDNNGLSTNPPRRSGPKEMVRDPSSTSRQARAPLPQGPAGRPSRTDLKPKKTPPPLYAPRGIAPMVHAQTILGSFDDYFTQLSVAQSAVLSRIQWGRPIPASNKQSSNSLDFKNKNTRKKKVVEKTGLALLPIPDDPEPFGKKTPVTTIYTSSSGWLSKRSPRKSTTPVSASPKGVGSTVTSAERANVKSDTGATPARGRLSLKKKTLCDEDDPRLLADKFGATKETVESRISVAGPCGGVSSVVHSLSDSDEDNASSSQASTVLKGVGNAEHSCVDPGVAALQSGWSEGEAEGTPEPDKPSSPQDCVCIIEDSRSHTGYQDHHDNPTTPSKRIHPSPGSSGGEYWLTKQTGNSKTLSTDRRTRSGAGNQSTGKRRAHFLDDSDTDSNSSSDNPRPVGHGGGTAEKGSSSRQTGNHPYLAPGSLLTAATRNQEEKGCSVIDLTEESQSRSVEYTQGSLELEEPMSDDTGHGEIRGGGLEFSRRRGLQDDLQHCPVCQKAFPQSVIEIHAADCNGNDSDDSDGVLKLTSLWNSKSSSGKKVKRPTLEEEDEFEINSESSEEEEAYTEDDEGYPIPGDGDTDPGGKPSSSHATGPQLYPSEDGGYIVDPSTVSDSPVRAFTKIGDLDPRERANFYGQFDYAKARRGKQSSKSRNRTSIYGRSDFDELASAGGTAKRSRGSNTRRRGGGRRGGGSRKGGKWKGNGNWLSKKH